MLKLLMSALDGDGQGTDNALFNGIGACGARRGARRTSRRSQRKQQIEEHVTWVSSGSARRRSAAGSRPTPEAASPRWRHVRGADSGLRWRAGPCQRPQARAVGARRARTRRGTLRGDLRGTEQGGQLAGVWTGEISMGMEMRHAAAGPGGGRARRA